MSVSDRWTDLLRESGYEPGAELGSGMEGTVISLGDDLVAKIWHGRGATELETLQTFYKALSASGAAFDAPDILRILCLQEQCATVERLLRGRPLSTSTDAGSRTLDDHQIDCITAVLGSLATVDAVPDMGVLPILEDEPRFDTQSTPFELSLAHLVERRVEKFHGPLSARLPGLDQVAASVVDRLADLEAAKSCLVHGDLIPANILVDDTSRLVAVLDFGFMSTVGDPAFDAAITASVYDMYGPRAMQNEATLDIAIGQLFGYAANRLAVYRAAYALTTSNCFSASGQDGHFDWCLRMLERPDIRDAIDV